MPALFKDEIDRKFASELQEAWNYWLNDFASLTDGLGFIHCKYAGALADQPAVDRLIYMLIKNEMVPTIKLPGG